MFRADSLTGVLMHPARLVRPAGELVLVGLEFRLELSYDVRVLVEKDLNRISVSQSVTASTFFLLFFSKEANISPNRSFFMKVLREKKKNKEQDTKAYRPIPLPKPLKPLIRALELVRGQLLLVHLGGDVPHLAVLVAEQDDGARGLGVEGRRHVQDGVLDNLPDTRVWDRALGREAVVGAAVLDGGEEGFRGGHCFLLIFVTGTAIGGVGGLFVFVLFRVRRDYDSFIEDGGRKFDVFTGMGGGVCFWILG